MGGALAMSEGRFVAVDTASTAPHERFELWSSLFPFTDMTPLRRAPYQSSAKFYADGNGGLLARIRMDATLSNFPEGRSDQIMLSLFLDGRSQGLHRGHEDIVDASSGFHLMDCKMPMRTVAQQHESIHLLLPRTKVCPLLGKHPAGDGRALRHLPGTPMGEILKAHLLATTQHCMALEPDAAKQAMASVNALALAYLAQFQSDGKIRQSDALLFDAACRYIQAHLDELRLTVETIAAALSCSRTRLYRVFAERGLSVAGHLRDQRLSHSRQLLRQSPMRIGDIALYCGYGDLPAYSKAFKRRFGMSPSECRSEHVG